MESRKSAIDEEISKRKAEKGIENMELIYQHLEVNEQAEEDEDRNNDEEHENK